MGKKIIIRDEVLDKFSGNYKVNLIPSVMNNDVSMLRVFKNNFNGYSSVLAFNLGLDVSPKHVFDDVSFVNYNSRITDALEQHKLNSFRSVNELNRSFGAVIFNGITSDLTKIDNVLDDNSYIITSNSHGVAYDLWKSDRFSLLGGISRPNNGIMLKTLVDGFSFNEIVNEENYFKSMQKGTPNQDLGEKYIFIKD